MPHRILCLNNTLTLIDMASLSFQIFVYHWQLWLSNKVDHVSLLKPYNVLQFFPFAFLHWAIILLKPHWPLLKATDYILQKFKPSGFFRPQEMIHHLTQPHWPLRKASWWELIIYYRSLNRQASSEHEMIHGFLIAEHLITWLAKMNEVTLWCLSKSPLMQQLAKLQNATWRAHILFFSSSKWWVWRSFWCFSGTSTKREPNVNFHTSGLRIGDTRVFEKTSEEI